MKDKIAKKRGNPFVDFDKIEKEYELSQKQKEADDKMKVRRFHLLRHVYCGGGGSGGVSRECFAAVRISCLLLFLILLAGRIEKKRAAAANNDVVTRRGARCHRH